MPLDWESDRRVTEHAGVIGIVGVLPDIVAAEINVTAEVLFEPGMKLIAKAGRKRRNEVGAAGKQRIEDGIGTAFAGEYQILIERSLERTRIGDAQNGAGARNRICHADARFGLTGVRKPVVDVTAESDIKKPVTG